MVRSSNNATKLNIIIFTILVIIVGGLGYYFFIMKKDRAKPWPPSDDIKKRGSGDDQNLEERKPSLNPYLPPKLPNCPPGHMCPK